MLKFVAFAACCGIGVLSFCQSSFEEAKSRQLIEPDRSNSKWALDQPYVIIISIDGFRYDYIEKFGTDNLRKISSAGVRASRMIPGFPSKTFPNHYSIITGMYPGNHGIVSNEFYSRKFDDWYSTANRGSLNDPKWYNGKPLWVLAEEQGMLTASYYWIGSDVKIAGYCPTYRFQYSKRTPDEYRFEQALDWLRLEPEKRPHFISLYFSPVDDVGHEYGPDATETENAVLRIDSLIGVFYAQLSTLPFDVNVIFVSDHGMTSIDTGYVLNDILELEDSKVAWSFPPMIYQPDSVKVERYYSVLSSHPGIKVWRRGDTPEKFHFNDMDRVGDLVLLTDSPDVILKEKSEVTGGTHGYDPFTETDMSAIFIATGPGVKSNTQLDTVENVHIYPFVAALLGLEIRHQIDGDIRHLKEALNAK